MATHLLVGRDVERRKLRRALKSTCTGTGRVVLLGGDAGIGKSALIADLAAHANAHDIAVHIGYCINSDTPAAYGPWIELTSVARLSEESPSGVVAGLAGDPGSMDIFAEIERLITSATSERPIVLVLEDLHWADQASLDLFLALARHIGRMPLLLVGSYRPLDTSIDKPFARLLPEFHRLEQVEHLYLSPLDLSALSSLARNQYQLNPADAGRLARYLLRYAGGNPFYTAELLATLEHQGLIQEQRDSFEIGQLHEAVIPPIVQQLVQTRIANIDDDLLRPLQAAAVLGERFSYDQWLAISGEAKDDLRRAISAGVESRILASSLNRHSLTFSHELIREALYQTIAPADRRDLHRRIANLLIDQSQPDPDSVAHHLSQCDAPEAVDWLMQAGDRAFAAHAWVVARERFQEALNRMDSRPDELERRAWLLYRLALAKRWEEDLKAIELLTEAASLAEMLGDRILEAYCAFFTGSIYWLRDESERAMSFIEACVDLFDQAPVGGDVSRFATTLYGFQVDDDPKLAAFNPVEGSITVFFAVAGRHREALERGRAFLKANANVPLANDTAAKAFGDAHNGIALSLAMLGQPDTSRKHFDRAVEIHDQPNMKAATVEMMLRTLIIPYFATDEDEFELQLDSFERLMHSFESVFTYDTRLLSLSRQHRWLLVRSSWGAAERSATTYEGFLGVNSYQNDATATLAELCRLRGDYDLAWSHIEAILPAGPEQEPGTIRYTTGIYGIQTAASLALDQNDLDRADAWIQAHRRWLKWSEAVPGRAEHHLLDARYRLAVEDVEQARSFARLALNTASDPVQPLALIAAHRLLGRVARDREEFEEAADQLREARATAKQARARFERAIVEIEQIALDIATREAAGLSNRIESVRALLEELGAAPALARLAEIEDHFLSMPGLPTGLEGLTARETDVLKLVAVGLSNTVIAERLSISPRTVTTHLSSIYRKLDTSSRTAITRIAIEHGLAQ